MNRRTLGHGLAALLTTHAARRASAQEPEILDVRKIWDAAPHNAFTDLIRHRDRWWCVFRSPHGLLVTAPPALRLELLTPCTAYSALPLSEVIKSMSSVACT